MLSCTEWHQNSSEIFSSNFQSLKAKKNPDATYHVLHQSLGYKHDLEQKFIHIPTSIRQSSISLSRICSILSEVESFQSAFIRISKRTKFSKELITRFHLRGLDWTFALASWFFWLICAPFLFRIDSLLGVYTRVRLFIICHTSFLLLYLDFSLSFALLCWLLHSYCLLAYSSRSIHNVCTWE